MEKVLLGCLLMLGQFVLLPAGARDRPQARFPSRGRHVRTHPQTALLESSCENKRADLVFIIDSSRSVNAHDYAKVKEFILDILQFLDIGPDVTRVGLLQYGSTVKNEFSLKTFKRKSEVERAVRRMRHLSTGTMTGLAIQYALNIAFSEAEGARPLRENVPRVMMIVTDGRPQDSVAEVAAKARDTGILIFAIGVGQVDLNTLKAIGSEPYKDHVFLVANFSQIESLTSVFQNKFCTVHMCSVLEHNCAHFCINTPGSYNCRCKQGYILNADQKTCRIQDLCASEDHGCEQLCVNLPGSFVCQCYSGYTLAEDGKHCTAVDYCASGNHGCEHECVNAESSYLCQCHEGFALNSDKKTCTRKDVCKSTRHGCEHICVNNGDFYTCQCSEGFVLAEDGKHCKRCTEGPIDLVFVIDGSKSLGEDNFEIVKHFVTGIIDSLAVSPKAARVGLLQYSTQVRSEFTLRDFSSAKDMKKAVVHMKYMGKGSMTGLALKHMFERSFTQVEGARPLSTRVPRVAIVFTDGRAQDDVSEWASKAKANGITMYAVGVGKAIEEELQEIASEPTDKHLFYAEDFSTMGEISEKLKQGICEALEDSDGRQDSPAGEPPKEVHQPTVQHRYLFEEDNLSRSTQKLSHSTKSSVKDRGELFPSAFSGSPLEESQDQCKCENLIMFQNLANEEVRKLTQRYISSCT
ncbi:Matn2 [Lemmus lemmus]